MITILLLWCGPYIYVLIGMSMNYPSRWCRAIGKHKKWSNFFFSDLLLLGILNIYIILFCFVNSVFSIRAYETQVLLLFGIQNPIFLLCPVSIFLILPDSSKVFPYY
ncbi:hypothetical protein AAZV13_02G247400 [Glycine max]